jgi:hypothetical protein
LGWRPIIYYCRWRGISFVNVVVGMSFLEFRNQFLNRASGFSKKFYLFSGKIF